MLHCQIHFLLKGTDWCRDLPSPSVLNTCTSLTLGKNSGKKVSLHKKEEHSSPRLDKKGLPNLSSWRKRPEEPRCNAETSKTHAFFWCLTTKTPLQHKRADVSPGRHHFTSVLRKLPQIYPFLPQLHLHFAKPHTPTVSGAFQQYG